MADDSQAKPDRAQEKAATRGTQSAPERVPEEVRFSVEQLIENPGLVNSNSRAVFAALSGVNSPKTFTLDAAAERVQAFLDHVEEGREENEQGVIA